MDYIRYQLKCCFGPHACSFCGIGPLKESTSTRLMYSMHLVLLAILCGVAHFQYTDNPLIESSEILNRTCIRIGAGNDCSEIIGYVGVYRLCLTFFIFHCLMSLLTVKVESSRSWRANIHNGFWIVKIVILLVLWACSLLIPMTETNIQVCMWVGIMGSFAFIFVQQVGLIDFAYEWDGLWRAKGQRNCCFSCLLVFMTLLIYFVVLLSYVLLILFYAFQPQCRTNRVFIIINFGSSAFLTIISALPLRDRHTTAWLPAAVTSLIVVFLTWTSLSSEPPLEVRNETDWSEAERAQFIIKDNVSYWLCRGQFQNSFLRTHFGAEMHAIIAIVIIVICVIYSSIRTSMQYERIGITPSRSKLNLQIVVNRGEEDAAMARSPMDAVVRRPPRDQRLHELQQANTGSCGSLPDHTLRRHEIRNPEDVNSSIVGSDGEEDEDGDRVGPLRSALRHSKIRNSVLWASEESLTLERPDKKRRLRFGGKMSASVPNLQSGLAKASIKRVSLTNLAPINRTPYVIRNEWEATCYSYPWFHLIFALTGLFMMSQITNWYNPKSSHLVNPGESWATVWMKFTSSWIVLLLFGYTLMCPRFCAGRNLYEHHYETYQRNRLKRKRGRSQSSDTGV